MFLQRNRVSASLQLHAESTFIFQGESSFRRAPLLPSGLLDGERGRRKGEFMFREGQRRTRNTLERESG